MTRKQVRDALVSLIAAGHETSTNTLIWTMYLLSEHPVVFATMAIAPVSEVNYSHRLYVAPRMVQGRLGD